MGAAFSPTIANIFMSVKLKKFPTTQPDQTLLLARYIFINEETLDQFLIALNQFHPNLKFTLQTFRGFS